MSRDPMDIAQLLRTARRAGPDDEALARVWHRLQAPAPAPTDPGPGAELEVPDPSALAAGVKTLAGKAGLVAGIKAIAVTVALAGATVGAVNWRSGEAPQPASPTPREPASVAAPRSQPLPVTPIAPVQPVTAPDPIKAPRAAVRAPEPDMLARERLLIAGAQAALQRRDLADAHAQLDAHARRFAHGALADEREVLRVLALCQEDRRSEAAAIANALIGASGAGLFLPRLRGSCVGEQLAGAAPK